MENINEALSLLVVGMVMVFIILLLVVAIGNVVILITNRYIPAMQKATEGGATKGSNPKKLAAIAAVVDMITQGEGRVDSIQKK